MTYKSAHDDQYKLATRLSMDGNSRARDRSRCLVKLQSWFVRVNDTASMANISVKYGELIYELLVNNEISDFSEHKIDKVCALLN